MFVKDMLKKIETVVYPDVCKPVYQTTAEEISCNLQKEIAINKSNVENMVQGNLRLLVITDSVSQDAELAKINPPDGKDWSFIKLNKDGSGEIIVSKSHLLFSTWCYLFEYLKNNSIDDYANGKLLEMGFLWNRPVFDCCLTQVDRTARNFDWKTHIKEYARMGCSHVEVNSLSTPHGMEPQVLYEVLPVFYTYCACADQFVHSKLNDGCYPREYLSSNLALMKKYSEEALKYGMTPGMHSFEPRSVPDSLLQKYPMLRGARVDHPFRSLKPRYNLSISHPFVRMHYKELFQTLLKEIPELGYLSIVTNDSGAGFEFTRSLYVGANGGAYLIREWNTPDDVAKAAGKNAMRFFNLVKDAASEINPDFRVMLRLEPFGDERKYILEGLKDRIDVEGVSFHSQGYDPNYFHEMYEDVAVSGSAWQTKFNAEEKIFMDSLEEKGSRAHAIYSYGLMANFDPLLGIPFPWMVYEKLSALHQAGAKYIVNTGGSHPPSLAPWCTNREIVKLFQHNPTLNVNDSIKQIATNWVGSEFADDLYHTWELVQKSIRAYPQAGLYSMTGMDWYRLWSRPIIPNIEAISEKDREYYERFLLSTPNNPNRVDLDKDVLFELTGKELAEKNYKRIDANVLPALKIAITFLSDVINKSKDACKANNVFNDLHDRLRALQCWIVTQRNTQAWIAGVHGYLQADNDFIKKEYKAVLKEMVLSEIENTKVLLELWNTSDTDFIVISDKGESVHILGENFGEHLQKKIELMQGHENDDPYIDPDYMWRVPGLNCYSLDDLDC